MMLLFVLAQGLAGLELSQAGFKLKICLRPPSAEIIDTNRYD